MRTRDFRETMVGARIAFALADRVSTPDAKTAVIQTGRPMLPIDVAADCGPEERQASGDWMTADSVELRASKSAPTP
jgi:hypothetical protein